MQEWLTSVGTYRVERTECPHPNVPVDMTRPPTGVLHTTEGGWDGSMSVFRRSSAPHFLVGRDRVGRVRVAQLTPLGRIGAALKNDAAPPETNRWVRAQIELVGFSQQTPWLPDPKVLDALCALMKTLEDVAEIPLTRPFGDDMPGGTWATVTNTHRQSGNFGAKPGWYGHMDIPENDHWDPGHLRWSSVLAHEPVPLEKRVEFQAWMRWHLSGRKKMRPSCLPERIPQSWWEKLKELRTRDKTPAPHA